MAKLIIVNISLLLIFSVTTVFAGEDEYKLGPGDIIKVTVYGHPDLTTTLRLDSDGTILFPLVGQLNVNGQTTMETVDEIAHALSGDYVVNPQVSVFVEKFQSKKVVIIGEVVKPGMYEMSGPTTLFELISLAEGLKSGAGTMVTIRRGASPEKPGGELIKVNLKEIIETGQASVDVPLVDGDTITVPIAGMIYVTGEVNSPSAYRLERGTTVIKAITMAGGFTPLASQGKVSILRKVNGVEQKLTKVPMHEPLLPEDVIIVPESFF